jgi:hypothetical protein
LTTNTAQPQAYPKLQALQSPQAPARARNAARDGITKFATTVEKKDHDVFLHTLKNFNQRYSSAASEPLSDTANVTDQKGNAPEDYALHLKALYAALRPLCVCHEVTPGTSKQLVARLGLTIDKGKEDLAAQFRLLFPAHPHSDDVPGQTCWQDTQICVFRTRY